MSINSINSETSSTFLIVVTPATVTVVVSFFVVFSFFLFYFGMTSSCHRPLVVVMICIMSIDRNSCTAPVVVVGWIGSVSWTCNLSDSHATDEASDH
jgi:hypothetical protein